MEALAQFSPKIILCKIGTFFFHQVQELDPLPKKHWLSAVFL
jgi:hypothetical protein